MPFQKGHKLGFKKGQSGNPAGRPKKGTAYTDKLRETITIDEFVAKIRELFMKGDKEVVKMVWDRFEGKVPDTLYQGNIDNLADLFDIVDEMKNDTTGPDDDSPNRSETH